MFVQTGDFVNNKGMEANKKMTFYGQEKTEFNAKLCAMNMAVHGLNGNIASGEEANTFYHDVHELAGKCDYVMANPPFNVDKVKVDDAHSAGRLPFGLPTVNKKKKEVGNANYLWISYFYAYLNEHGRAGFVMAASATDGKEADMRRQLVEEGAVDVMVSVGNNFFYTLSLPCSLWFFNKAKTEQTEDKVLFIDARNYYTVVDRNLNEWSEWQLRNLTAIVWLYRGEKEKYQELVADYKAALVDYALQAQSTKLAQLLTQTEDLQALQKTSRTLPKRCRKKRRRLWTRPSAMKRRARVLITTASWLSLRRLHPSLKLGSGWWKNSAARVNIRTLQACAKLRIRAKLPRRIIRSRRALMWAWRRWQTTAWTLARECARFMASL